MKASATPTDAAAASARARLTLIAWCWQSAWRQQPGALATAVIAIALGVALALAIDLVNRSALGEFSAAIATVNGDAQAQLTARAGALPDATLDSIEADPAISAASPVLDVEVRANAGESMRANPDASRPPDGARVPQAESMTLRIVGIDLFRAARITPGLIPTPARDGPGGAATTLFADDAVFLSAAARQRLGVADGDTLTVTSRGRTRELVVRGAVEAVPADQALAVMDIAAAQWQLGRLGELSRIDLRLADGATVAALRARFAEQRPDLSVAEPDDAAQRMSNLSRAYRVNLNVLALVALLTGGFIVHATLTLAVTRLLPMIALLGVLGAPRRLVGSAVAGLSLVLGGLGAVLGVAAGIGLAQTMLRAFGGDLGGGYFAAGETRLVLSSLPLAGFGMLGVVTALVGGLSAVNTLGRVAPARALKGARTLPARGLRAGLVRDGLLALAGLALLQAPAIAGLPLAAYAGIACWLFAGVGLTAPLIQALARLAAAHGTRPVGRPMIWLGLQRLDAASASAAAALAGVVASFALVCAMLIMVHSFRQSVDQWLEAVLPADVYLRVSSTGADGGLDARSIADLRALPEVDRVEPLRTIEISLDPERPALALLARPIDAADPQAMLPLTGEFLRATDPALDACVPAFASEPAARIHGWRIGQRIGLPLGPAGTCYVVAGIWRDYARQHGAVALDLATYRSLTSDQALNDAGVWLADGADEGAASIRIRETLARYEGLEVRTAGAIRALSLQIFDRSFAITYALEWIALLVGLFGVATTYAGEALSRLREFGVLRHLGITRAGIGRLLAAESGASLAIGVGWGGVLGALISQVLIHRVNPQSFNWTMQTHWPVTLIVASGAALILLGVVTAVVAARSAGSRAPIAAVRADW